MASLAYMLPGATAADDCYLFNREAPPRTRAESQRRPVQSSSFLCEACLGVFEYLAFVIEEIRSGRPSTQDSDLLMVAVHHESLACWLENYDGHCHFCYFIGLHLKWRRDWQQHLSDVQLEISWGSHCIGAKDPKDVKRGRLYLALTRKSLERTPDNYDTFMRFQTWPARKNYGPLFLALSQPPNQSDHYPNNDAASVVDDRSGTSSDSGPTDSASDEEGGNYSGDVSKHGSENGNEYSSDRNSEDEPEDGPEDGSRDRPGAEAEDGFDDRASGTRVVRYTAGSTGSPFSQKLVKIWLARCLENEEGEHMECDKSGEHWLPTRLLDVEFKSENRLLRLVSPAESPELFETDRRYITISHCWGKWGSEALTVLKSSNKVERCHRGFDLEEVPQTFRDAVEVAHWLQVRWLWIDSFCIVQDDHQDWQRESSLMQDVYEQGFLNIAASTAMDARGGLFKPRSSLALQPVKLYMPGVDEMFYLTVDERNMFGWMETDPLSQRAWVFQERHLARRILHFTRTEIFWECCAKAPHFASETFTRGAPLDTIFNGLPKLQSESVLKQSNPSIEEIYDLWGDICQMYSEKHLTHQRDKLIALSGLAKEFQEFLPEDEYIA
ncbi:MAG: hypothetical protein Q9218_006870, partial [Villophora microphyllina]